MARKGIEERRAARESYKEARKKPLGEGSRFAAVEREAAAGGARDPGAVAASAGRKAHGQRAMTHYSKMGRKK